MRLLTAIAHAYHRLGYFDQARPLLERLLDLEREIGGDDHPASATTLTDLG